MFWVWLIVVGAVVGVLGRLLHPGRELMGFFFTILVGIISLLFAGVIFGRGFWSFVVGSVVAAILVTIIARFTTHPAV
jgi:uncharacterized membrane protein YeaQ/YmgE (transglycosylase-associated protein family)